jgi:ribose transport system ATP-binding protein
MTNILSVSNVSKVFGAVRALDGVSFGVMANEVVGLIGENGAGKSTLLKVLNGVYQPDEGVITNAAGSLTLRSPLDAEHAGIGMVHQEQSLLLNISVAENLYLGRESQFIRYGKINWKAMHGAARRQLEKVKLSIPPATRTELLSFAQRQMVELAKALILEEEHEDGLVILLDEPTSVLENDEIKILFDRVRTLRDRVSFVFVSHRLDEVMELSDRMYVMRDGKVVGQMTQEEATTAKAHEMMVGRNLDHDYYSSDKRKDIGSDTALSVEDLSRPGEFSDVSFDIKQGEILGICGVIGSGRESVMRCIAGLAPPQAGTISVGGRIKTLKSPSKAVNTGIGYVPQERRVEGLVMQLSVMENISLPSIGQFKKFGLISTTLQKTAAAKWVKRLSIRPPDYSLPASSLSGGNQQKVVLAKWIQAGAGILVLDHPTRGVDVGAKQEVYELIRELAAQGIAILLTADTLEESLGLSDKIIVMRDQKITARFSMQEDEPKQVDIIRSMV